MNLIFIGGSGRSGTTLVQKILILHSQIAGGPEFDHLPALMKNYSVMSSKHHIDRQKFFYDENNLSEKWRSFIGSFFSDALVKKPGAIYFSEKTPDNLYAAEELLTLFPNSKFIYMYRDGRDVVNSFLQVKKKYKEAGDKSFGKRGTAKNFASAWVAANNFYFSLKEKENLKGRMYEVKYEELTSSPAIEIPKLMQFIGLETEASQLTPAKFSSGETQMKIDNLWYDEKKFSQDFNTSNIGKWKSELGLLDKFFVQIIEAKKLNQLGYKVSSFYLQLNKIAHSILSMLKII